MTLIVNPGSRIDRSWPQSREAARGYADAWLKRMTEEGFCDVEMTDTGRRDEDGRWVFEFRHTVTGKVVCLEHHGIDNLEEYRKARLFEPRVYWNGSSSANPQLADFAAKGFEMVQTFRAVE